MKWSSNALVIQQYPFHGSILHICVYYHRSKLAVLNCVTMGEIDPGDFDREVLMREIEDNCYVSNNCMIWGKHYVRKTSNGYPIKSFLDKHNNTRDLRVHRLYYSLCHSVILRSSRIWHVSHRCGDKNCIGHLSLEP